MSESFVILAKCSQKRQFARKNSYFCIFLTVFHCFSSFLCPRAICSYHSLQKSDCERIAPIALYKRATVSVSLKSLMTKERQERLLFFTSESLFCSQKRSICSKNRWANSQPWKILVPFQGISVQRALDHPPDYKYVLLVDPSYTEQELNGQDGDRILLSCYVNHAPVSGYITFRLRQQSNVYTVLYLISSRFCIPLPELSVFRLFSTSMYGHVWSYIWTFYHTHIW